MRNSRTWIPAIFILLWSDPAPAAAGGLDRDLRLGGTVSLDDESRLDAAEDPKMGLSEVSLGADVALSEGIQAAVVLKAEDALDTLFFDQAVASFTPDGSHWVFYIGQQTFNHGYLTTRLISDPLLLDWVEMKRPGAAATYASGGAILGTGLVVAETDVKGAVSRDYALLPSVDWTRGPVQARASGIVSRYRSDVDLAASLAFGRFTFDAEGFSRLPVWDDADRTSGFSLGGEFKLGHGVATAFRQDGLAPKPGDGLTAWRFGAGLSYTLRRDLFAAAEYAFGRGIGEAGHRLALRIGLKSTLHLPGFQRETLSQP